MQTTTAEPPSPVLFHWQVRVYYEDTDVGGIVYYANYLKFFERCRTEWLRSLGVGQRELAERHNLQFVVARATLEYRRPARLDDLLDIDMRITRLARVYFEFRQAARRGAELLATLQLKAACIDTRSFVPRPLPEAIAGPLKRCA